jgi:4-hydroxy-3-methylbut-2-enyl diphosphate reductase
MSDEKTEQEWKSTHIYEMSETPFGSGLSDDSAEPTQETPEEKPGGESEAVIESQSNFGVEAKPQESEEQVSMESAMAEMGGQGVDYSGTFKSLNVGDVVDGVVVHIDKEGVLVDVGTKSEGVIRPGELARDPSLTPEEVVSVGEKIKVYVVESESQEGGPLLSKKRADFENAWERVEKAYSDGSVLKAMVTDRVKGGLVVDLGIRGFVPASHVGSGKLKNLDKFVGQSLPFKVIEVDRDRRKVVLSNRLAVEEEQEALRQKTLASLREGQIREGIVRRITDYGAFVDLGGVDGLLHISEMSWTRINHPSEAVKVGQKIQVMVLKFDLEQGKVSLGLRQILPDPWEDVRRRYKVGDVITGTVTRLVPFGAFVQVEGGIEGIIPNAELASRRVNNPDEIVSPGQQIEAKIIDLRPDERRMTLSVKQLQIQREKEREEDEYRTYAQTQADAGRTTIGDLIGEQLDNLGFGRVEAEEASRKKSRARAAKREKIEEAEALAEAEEMIFDEQAESDSETESVANVVEQSTDVSAVEESGASASGAETLSEDYKAEEVADVEASGDVAAQAESDVESVSETKAEE